MGFPGRRIATNHENCFIQPKLYCWPRFCEHFVDIVRDERESLDFIVMQTIFRSEFQTTFKPTVNSSPRVIQNSVK